ncbi:unnamed protein product [Lactuca saligna]|uniref:Uncharacterized protein n=1 Tax=Lactuca saligna TaxID=75948 RepID=A0AA35Y071_LACSI|nr:unnamed protein product [Lactuca saligna]
MVTAIQSHRIYSTNITVFHLSRTLSIPPTIIVLLFKDFHFVDYPLHLSSSFESSLCFGETMVDRSYRKKASSHHHSPSVSGCFQIDVLGETMVDRWIVGFLILDFPSISALHPSSLSRSLGLIEKRHLLTVIHLLFLDVSKSMFWGKRWSTGLIGKRHLLTVTQYLFLMFPNRCFGGKDGRWVHSRVFNSRFPIHFCFASVFTNSIPRSYRKKASSHRHSPSVSGCFQIDVLGETMVDRWIVGFLILDFPSISALHPSSLIRSLGLLGKMHLLTVTHLLFLDVSKSMFWGKRWSTGLIGKWHLLTIAHLLFLDVSKSMFWGNHGRLVDCRFFDSRFPVHFCFASVFTNSIPRSYRTKASSHCHSPSVSGCFQIDVLGETMVDRSYRKKGIFSPSLTNCVWMFPNRCFKGNDGRPKKASSHRHSPFWMFPNRCFVGNDGRLVDSLIGKRDLLTVTQLLFLDVSKSMFWFLERNKISDNSFEICSGNLRTKSCLMVF